MSGLHTHRHIHAVRAAAAALAVAAVTAFAVVPAGAAHAAPPGTTAKTTASPTLPTVPTNARKQTAKKPTSPGARRSALPTPEEIQSIAVPLDRELAGAVRMLKAAGIDQMALQAAQVILASNGQLTAESLNKAAMSVYNNIGTSRSGYAGEPGRRQVPVLPTVKTVKNTGAPRTTGQNVALRTLTPKSSPLCTRPTSDNPLGLATPVGQPSGLWPVTEFPRTLTAAQKNSSLPRLSLPAGIDPRLINTGEVAFALIPPASPRQAAGTRTSVKAGPVQKLVTPKAPSGPAKTPAPATGPLRIAWLNTTTLQGGFADLVTDSRTGSWLRALASSHGLRLAPVKSRYGTELAVVSRAAGGDERSCSFVPAVNLTGV
ncbi:hypothetical protein [Gordonia amarae]|uniref:hypothetical protein n=1 Tax=Gordonia amarae TaxID=36821 RepID=UPI001AFB6514|nr:hypothetical protein [Gordonia amarae]QHN18367.1 hypothetical protein GII35_16635 [Gordonia amarae]QHN22849.1 hypothetical protein GII34_16175 [Gordonia amarae]